MLSYCSVEYLILFLPAVMIVYQIMPRHLRKWVLLAAGYGFFWYLSGPLVLWNVAVAVCVWLTGLKLSALLKEREQLLEGCERSRKKEIRKRCEKKMRFRVILAGVVCFGILITLKYSAFIISNLNAVLRSAHVTGRSPIPQFLVPVGISFYTLQAMSYVFDVQKEKIPAERNFFKVALFLSFFPLLMEGPIARFKETAPQLWDPPGIHMAALQRGGWRILYGVIKKLVVADRVNAAVELLYTDYASYDGGMVFLAAVLFTLQEYMEFSGTIDIVAGTGECLGITLPENFRQPFFSATISEFWTRWHVSLGAWLRDYVFYPLSMSAPLKKLTKKCKKRLGNHYGPLVTSSIALLAVWVFNGFWHGSGWSFLFFGLYHFTWIVTGNILQPGVAHFCERHQINRRNPVYRTFQIIRTCLIVAIGEMFFRALSLKCGLQMFVQLFARASLRCLTDGTALSLGMDLQDYLITGVAIVFVLVIGILREREYDIRSRLMEKNMVIRSLVTVSLIVFIIVFGAYGEGYVPVDPIYANF